MKKMFKRVTSFITALAMTMTLTGGVQLVSFAEEEAIKTVLQDSITISIDEYELSDDELLLGYFENKLYGIDGGISTFAIANSASLKGNYRTIYDTVYAAAKQIAAGERASTAVNIPNLSWKYSDFNTTDFDTAADALDLEFDAMFSEIYGYLLRDNPYEFYWHKKKISTNKYSVKGDGTNITIEGLIIYLDVGSDYAVSTEYTVDTAKTSSASSAAANAKAIVAENAEKTELERLTAYKEAICERVSYDDNAAANINNTSYGVAPWQVIHVFDNDSETNVVCEGYAKAFQYLCDLDEGGLTCYSVSGTMSGGTGSGPHMWNIVTLGGKNYLVDVTSCDGDSNSMSIGYPDKLFLKGMTYDSATGYYYKTINEQNIIFAYDSNMASLFGTDILTLSTTDYSEAPKTITSITVQTPPTKTEYYINEEFDPTGLVIRVNYSDNSYEDVTYSDTNDKFSDDLSYVTLNENQEFVPVTYDGQTAEIPVTVLKVVVVTADDLGNPAGYGWWIDNNTLNLDTGCIGYKFIFECECTYQVKNNGTIISGTFNSTVSNDEGGTITGGTFNNDVSNYGTITGGTFNYGVINYDGATISDGTFNNGVTNNDGATISGGDFNAVVSNNSGATISGGDFNAGLNVIENRGTITGGTFAEVENWAGATIEITNGSVEIAKCTMDNGTVKVNNNVHEHTILTTYTENQEDTTKHIKAAACENCPINYVESEDESESHSATVFTADDNVITAKCVCDKEMGTFTLDAPADLAYNGEAKAATVTGTVDGVATPTVEYYIGNEKLNAAPTNRGTYTAKITVDAATASVEYAIAKATPDIGDVTVYPNTIYDSMTIDDLVFKLLNSKVEGKITIDAGQTLVGGDFNDISWTFTPDDTDNYIVLTGTKEVYVTADTVQSITVKTTPTKTDYIVTEEFDPTGLVLTVTYNSGNTADVTYSEANADDFLFDKTTLAKEDTAVTVTYSGKTASETVSVNVTNVVTIDISELVQGVPSENTGWKWDGNLLTLSEGFEFIIEGENDYVVEVINYGTISGGTFNKHVCNYGTISGGTFNNIVTNNDGATISGGQFDGRVNVLIKNSGTITGGIFSGQTVNNLEGGKITDGEFANASNKGTITGGEFLVLVINEEGGTITGGDFYKVENLAGATIEITNGSVTMTQLTLDQGTIYVVVDDVKVKHTHIAGDDATYTNSGEKHMVSGQCKDCPVNYCFSDVEESHSATVFTAADNVITAECACGKEMGTFTLEKPAALNYTGKAKAATVTGEIEGVETPEIKYYDENENEAQPINAGTYTAKITVGEATAELDFTIAAKDIGDLLMSVAGREYTGEEQQVEIVLFDGNNNYTLVKGKDYRITSGASGTNADSYTATIEGMGNYTGTVNKIWYITKADPEISEVTVTTAKIFESTASENIELSYAKADTIPGALTADAGQNLTEGTVSLNWTFVPSDTQNYNTVTGTVDIIVTADTIKSIEVTGEPDKTEYVEGDKFDPTGLTVTATYESGATKEINNSLLTFTPETLEKDNTSVTVSYNGKTAEKPVGGIIVRGKLTADMFKFTAPTGLTYDKTAKSATVEVNNGITGVGAITVRYFNGNTELNSAPVNAGTYNVVIDVALGDEYVAATNLSDASWTFTIEKATPSINPSVTSPETIYDTTPVSSIVIDSGIDVEGTIKLDNVTELSDNVSSYPVIFIPNDTDNYNTVNGTVEITVEKDTIASIEVTTDPTKTEYTYGEEFDPKGLVITATYESGNEVDITYTADNKNEFSFTPDEFTVATTEVTVTYAEKNDTIEVKVNKAKPSYKAPTNLKANYGDTLADVVLPSGWSWDEPNTSVGDVGTKTFPATYSVADENYEDVKTELGVVVSPKTISIGGIVVQNKDYDGTTDATVAAVTFDGVINADAVDYTATGTFADKNAGENKKVTVKVTITNKNYTLDKKTYTATATINKIDPDVTIPQTASAITDQPLSKAKLPDGWTWDEPRTIPVDGQSYGITYTHDDTTNYNTITTQVTVTVSDCTHPETTVNIKDATCTVNGLKTTICKICDETTGTEVIPAAHNWNNDYTVDAEATCIKDGQKSIHCAECNEIKPDSTVAIPSGHNWNDDYTIDTEATCTTDGSKSIHCKNCTEIMPDSEVKIPAEHKWNEGYTSDNTKHWIGCEKCDETKDEGNHSYGYTAHSKQYCSVCRNSYAIADERPTSTPGAGTIHSIHTAPKPTEPQIKGENGKTGWDVISDEVTLAQDGDTVVVDMNGTTKLPKSILADIAGRNIDIVLDMGNGISWTINGETVTNPKAVDMRVSKNVKRIPVDVIDNVTGDNFNMEISLAHNGKFGFEAMLTISLGRKHNDSYANLYYYNPSDKAMEFIDSDLIANGNAQLIFNHASDYVVVIDEEALGDDVSSAAGVTAENEAMDTETVSVVFALPLVLAAGFVIRKKFCR